MDSTTALSNDKTARRNVWVLVAAQAILGAQMPMIFTIAGLAGQTLASNICWATLPITMSVVGSMLTATPLSALMQRFGRRAGFVVGALGGLLGAGIGAWGLMTSSFLLFLLGALFTGIYMSAQGFYRFAAADMASPEYRPKAISSVMAGGLLSAVVGPQLVKLTADSMVVPFLGTYLAVMALNMAGVFLFAFLDIPKPPAPAVDAPVSRSRMQMLREPRIAVAVICATVSYALMNLVMTSSPLAVVGCGFQTADAADIVTAHVLAMYAPAFFTGRIIARFGVETVVGVVHVRFYMRLGQLEGLHRVHRNEAVVLAEMRQHWALWLTIDFGRQRHATTVITNGCTQTADLLGGPPGQQAAPTVAHHTNQTMGCFGSMVHRCLHIGQDTRGWQGFGLVFQGAALGDVFRRVAQVHIVFQS